MCVAIDFVVEVKLTFLRNSMRVMFMVATVFAHCSLGMSG